MSSTSLGTGELASGTWFSVGVGIDCMNAVASVWSAWINFDISTGIDSNDAGILGKLDNDGISGNWGSCIDVNMLNAFGSIVVNCWNSWLKAWIKFSAMHNPLLIASADIACDFSVIWDCG